MVYLSIGGILGLFFRTRYEDVISQGRLLEYFTEFVVIVSIFAASTKLKLDRKKESPKVIFRLSVVAMCISVLLMALLSSLLFNFDFSFALLLAAILAPTDPVLASSVQVEDKQDTDKLRQALTGEAAINDSSAFPIIYLALGLAGVRELGSYGAHWFWKDLVWAISGGLLIGSFCGFISAEMIRWARKAGWETVILDDFIAMGIMGLSYGLALSADSYGFVAVFASGVTFRYVFDKNQKRETPTDSTNQDSNLDGMIQFQEQIERFAEMFAVIILGVLVVSVDMSWSMIGFAGVTFLLVRPVSVFLSLIGSSVTLKQKIIISWLGLKGIGSMFYLSYSIVHSSDSEPLRWIYSVTLVVISLSIVIHGATSSSLMKWYNRKKNLTW
ncbi:MAG: cation:proton antiporter [Bdellovibrionales bacterium]|nr:cation:proton antiporter [Bdellovibrionales bacterium]